MPQLTSKHLYAAYAIGAVSAAVGVSLIWNTRKRSTRKSRRKGNKKRPTKVKTGVKSPVADVCPSPKILHGMMMATQHKLMQGEIMDPEVKRVHSCIMSLAKTGNDEYSFSEMMDCVEWLTMYHHIFEALATRGNPEMMQLVEMQIAQEMKIISKLLDRETMVPEEIKRCNLMNLAMSTKSHDFGRMSKAFETLMSLYDSLSPEELFGAFQAAPSLGRWDDVVRIGEDLMNSTNPEIQQAIMSNPHLAMFMELASPRDPAAPVEEEGSRRRPTPFLLPLPESTPEPASLVAGPRQVLGLKMTLTKFHTHDKKLKKKLEEMLNVAKPYAQRRTMFVIDGASCILINFSFLPSTKGVMWCGSYTPDRIVAIFATPNRSERCNFSPSDSEDPTKWSGKYLLETAEEEKHSYFEFDVEFSIAAGQQPGFGGM